MRSVLGAVLISLAVWTVWDLHAEPPFDPHGDPDTGVLRVTTIPSTRGRCEQCHASHGDPWSLEPSRQLLFTRNNNRLAFWDEGDGPCHRRRPLNYPLTESDRLPDTELDAGYFEANVGGNRQIGVDYRGRWPGAEIYADPRITAEGHYISPHAHDADMPLRDGGGEGLCLNCHNPHPTSNPRDLLLATYGGIGGHASIGPPDQYALCLDCHGPEGPAGMDVGSRFLSDYYDAGLNGERAGHQIRRNRRIALSWPPHVREGDMLPCYDCHNPHGSEGNNGVEPNAFLISDQRPGWSGLTDTVNDPEQCRRFCFGCHIPSDGIPGSNEVEGIVMNTLSARTEHDSSSDRSCYDCHGRDYTGPTGYNVHHPYLRGSGFGADDGEDVERP